MKLNDKNHPWVNSVKHLGTTITDAFNDMGQDLLEKRAQCVAKSNELMQEFHYAHTSTKTMLNNVFNTHFYGAPCGTYFPQASKDSKVTAFVTT